MCGIFGFVSPRVDRPGEFYRFATRLFVESESRGRDASGFASLVDGTTLVTDKRPFPAEFFTKLSRPWRSLRGHRKLGLIGHTRAATCGSPDDNNNNHPFHGQRFVIAHNGWVGSHQILANFNKIGLKTECDSELILHFLESGATIRDGIIKAFNHLDDVSYMAVCVLDKSTGNIHLFRNTGSPCVIMRFKRWNTLVFASTARIVVDAAANIVDEWSEMTNHAELVFGTEIPAYADVVIKPSGHIEVTDLKSRLDIIKYQKTTSPAYSTRWTYGEDYGDYDFGVFQNMSQSTIERIKKLAQDDAKMATSKVSSLDDTQHDMWKCRLCTKPLSESKTLFPNPADTDDDRSYICETCYKAYQPMGSTHTDTVMEAKKNVLKMILPTSLADDKSPLETIYSWREPLIDTELSEKDQGIYMRSSDMPTERKIQIWEGMTYSRLLLLDDGEYLAYTDFLNTCLVTA